MLHIIWGMFLLKVSKTGWGWHQTKILQK